jgi:superfamily II helicase
MKESLHAYIINNIHLFKEMNVNDKFSFILSTSKTLQDFENKSSNIYISLAESTLTCIEILRFELAYNKATESNVLFDKFLVYEAYSIASCIYKNHSLIKYINDLLYYEKNPIRAHDLKERVGKISNN